MQILLPGDYVCSINTYDNLRLCSDRQFRCTAFCVHNVINLLCLFYIHGVNVLKVQIDVYLRLVVSNVQAAACEPGSECYYQCVYSII